MIPIGLIMMIMMMIMMMMMMIIMMIMMVLMMVINDGDADANQVMMMLMTMMPIRCGPHIWLSMELCAFGSVADLSAGLVQRGRSLI